MEWTTEINRQASIEGWNLFLVSGLGPHDTYRIMRIDCPPDHDFWEEGMSEKPIFDSDLSALLFVRAQAEAGVPYAQFAAKMHGCRAKDWDKRANS